MDRICKNCEHCKYDKSEHEYICFNEYANDYGCITDKNDGCTDFEEKEDE